MFFYNGVILICLWMTKQIFNFFSSKLLSFPYLIKGVVSKSTCNYRPSDRDFKMAGYFLFMLLELYSLYKIEFCPD